MNTNKILTGAIAGAAALFVQGYLMYEIIFKNSTIGMQPEAAEILNSQVNFSGIVVMELLYGLLLATVLNWKAARGFLNGLIPGGFIGLIVGLTFGLDLYSTTTLVNFNFVLFWGLTNLVRYSISGGIIAATFGYISK